MNEIKEFFDKIAPTYDIHDHHDYKLIQSMIDEIDIQTGEDVLDLACGKGVISALLYQKSKKRVTAIDLSSAMIQFAQEKNIPNQEVEFLNLDFYDYDQKQFDAIVLFDAYPHFIDRRKLKEKIYDSLKENGKFAILHDISREGLKKCHDGHSPNISRVLEDVKSEARFFEDKFIISTAFEDEHCFKIIMVKRK